MTNQELYNLKYPVGEFVKPDIIDSEILNDFMINEIRFSFMSAFKIDKNKKSKRRFFKSKDYLFHGIEYHLESNNGTIYLHQTKRFKGKLYLLSLNNII